MAASKQLLERINLHAAGIDIGSEEIFVSTAPGTVRTFSTFTASLLQARDYLLEEGIETVAMEATGVYWIPLFEILEEAGLQVCLVNGAHVKNVPGRKSDVLDCQWLQELHSYGLLRPCFIPDEAIRKLRSYVRLRQDHIEMAVRHVQHMQKSLDLMNVKLHKVISQVQGKSGLRIIKAILEGQRDPAELVELCDAQIKQRKRAQVIASLKGHYRQEHLFALKQAVTCWEFYQEQITQCEVQIEALLEEITRDLQEPETISKPKRIYHNKPDIEDLHLKMIKLTHGRDLAQLVGLTDLTVMKLVSEVGTDMTKWPTEKHFSSWLGLAPKTEQSGRRRRNRRQRRSNRAGQIFRESAQSIGRSTHLALGGFYRRIKARRGAPIAIVATARKLAVLFYRMMRYSLEYVEQGLVAYQAQYERQRLRSLQRQAKALGFELVAANP